MSGLTVLGPFDVCLSLLPGLAVADSWSLHTCVFFAACLQLCSYPILDHIHSVLLLGPSSLESDSDRNMGLNAGHIGKGTQHGELTLLAYLQLPGHVSRTELQGLILGCSHSQNEVMGSSKNLGNRRCCSQAVVDAVSGDARFCVDRQMCLF